jgi:RsiW-degrading membrane proteinase PrsW (M82 family)
MLFLIALVALVAYQLQRDIRLVRRLHPSPPWRSPVHRAGLIFVLLFTVPFLFVRYSGLGEALTLSSTTAISTYAFLSFLISYTWYRYLTWLDRFEPERTAWIVVVFLLSCGTTFLVFPLGSLIIPNLGLVMDGTAFHDWWYAVIGIGLVEETVKLLPLLVILLFTRQADEPFDLILYASISALGFAFIENMQYLASSEFHAIGGRVLYASVAHMVFSSIVAYSIAMTRRAGWPWAVGLFGGLVLASFAHGFYDFWLLAPDRPGVLTLLFFLANIHLWVMMKNNLINLSPHYQESMRPQPVMFRYRMINALSAIFLFTYVLKFLVDGEIAARDLLLAQGPHHGCHAPLPCDQPQQLPLHSGIRRTVTPDQWSMGLALPAHRMGRGPDGSALATAYTRATFGYAALHGTASGIALGRNAQPARDPGRGSRLVLVQAGTPHTLRWSLWRCVAHPTPPGQ